MQGVLPDADDFPALPSELVSDAFIAGHVVLKLFIPESSVGFWAGVALGAAVPEPSLWEQTRKTTKGSPKGVAPFAGKQMPSTTHRRRLRPTFSESVSRAFRLDRQMPPHTELACYTSEVVCPSDHFGRGALVWIEREINFPS